MNKKQIGLAFAAAASAGLAVSSFGRGGGEAAGCGASCGEGNSGPKIQNVSMTHRSDEARSAKVIVVAFHADWCPTCRVLGPKMKEAMSALAGEQVLVITLDQTDKKSMQAEYTLAALGLGELWGENAGKTGFALLVDAGTKKVVGKVRSDQSVDEIKSSIRSAIKA